MRLLVRCALAALAAVTATGAVRARVPAADARPAACLSVALGPEAPAAPRLVREAVRVLEQSGRRASDYRVELRREDAAHPDNPELGSRPVTSVVFVPRPESGLHALRVHPAHPCVAGWIWRPETFTPWQRRALEQAAAALGSSLAEVRAVRVLESDELLRVELVESTGVVDSPPRSVTLRKNDLRRVDVPE